MTECLMAPCTNRTQRGVISVEAAWVLPVVIATSMLGIELANLGLAVNMGAAALERAVQEEFRRDTDVPLQAASVAEVLRSRMARASHGHLDETEIDPVRVERFDNLHALGQGVTTAQGTDEAVDRMVRQSDTQAWHIQVDIRKAWITALPGLIGLDERGFRYRFQHVVAHTPRPQRESR